MTLTVTGRSGSADSVEQLTLEESQPADPALPVVDLAFGARLAGRYVTHWTHPDPGLILTIDEGWWVSDTLNAVSFGPLTEAGTQTCDPLGRVVVAAGDAGSFDCRVHGCKSAGGCLVLKPAAGQAPGSTRKP